MIVTNYRSFTDDDGSAGSRSNHDHSMVSASTTNNDAASTVFSPAAASSSYNAFMNLSGKNNNAMMMMMTESKMTAAANDYDDADDNDDDKEVDALTAEAENAVTKERQMLAKENTARLQSILESIKDSTKNILNEMNVFLKETEEVEKTYIRCRAKTQRETQRLDQVEPEVMGMLMQTSGGEMGLGGMWSFGTGGGGGKGAANAITPRSSL